MIKIFSTPIYGIESINIQVVIKNNKCLFVFSIKKIENKRSKSISVKIEKEMHATSLIAFFWWKNKKWKVIADNYC